MTVCRGSKSLPRAPAAELGRSAAEGEAYLAEETLDYPPFPPLKWEHYFWVGEVTLPSWAGFQAQRSGYGAVSSHAPSDGSARLWVTQLDNDARTHPTVEQVVAFRHLLDNEATVASASARALVRYCPGDAYDEDDERLLKVNEPDELRPLVGLSGVHELSVTHDGVAYIGFEFGCVWDGEHGAGLMTHLGRVVATGQADTSFLEWTARQDTGK